MTATLANRISAHRITARAVPDTDFTPRDDWDRGSRHWKVTLSRPDYAYPGHRRTLTVPFHTGSGLGPKPPKAVQVLACLLLDATGVAWGQSFEDWAGEYGYDTDSRKAEETYRQVIRQTEELRNFLLDRDDPWPMWLEQTDYSDY